VLNRRHFTAALAATAFAGLAQQAQGFALLRPRAYGDLAPDPLQLLDLPQGFSYRIISQFGQAMSDGYGVPDNADGMGCFDLGGSRIALVRNHELRPSALNKRPWVGAAAGPALSYDRTAEGLALPGGTTTIIYDLAQQRIESEYLSLVGTIRNCAGGITPWGSWLTCEEDTTRAGEGVGADHGYVFDVPALHKGLVDPVPLKAMGRFNHEAAAVDPRTGIVYMTEDRGDGLFYRFLPAARGRLAEGGVLQALGFRDAPNGGDSRNWNTSGIERARPKEAVWIDLKDPESPNDDLRAQGFARGAALFARGEGVHMGDNELYFCCTSGGAKRLGQVMRYRPSRFEGQPGEKEEPGMLSLFVESSDPSSMHYGDNLTIAPNGHLIVCEDQGGAVVDNHLRGVTRDGEVYPFARLRTQTELAGACFSPDGTTMFVNLYAPTKTLAITGPWASFDKRA
jgi:secreted PhoX family phosphatase